MAVRKKMKLAVPGNPLDPIDTLCKILTCDSDYSMVKSVGCLDPRFQHRFALSKELMEQIHKFLRTLKNVTLMLLVFSVILTVLHFPYDADAPLTPQEIKVAQEYYTAAYQKPVAKNHEKSGYETEYLRVAQAAADAYHVEDQVRAFVKRFNLAIGPFWRLARDAAICKTSRKTIPVSISHLAWHASITRNSCWAQPPHCLFRTTALTASGRFGCSNTCRIPNKHFLKHDALPKTREYFFCFQRGTVRPGLPMVTKSDLIPILVWVGSLSRQVSPCVLHRRL